MREIPRTVSVVNKSQVIKLECVVCGASQEVSGDDLRKQIWMTCVQCADEGAVLDIHYDLEAVRAAWKNRPLSDRPRNHWRYEELLPLVPDAVPHDWQVGWTPAVDAPRMAQQLGIRQMLLKDEGRNPSASFKDRASSVGVAHALQSRRGDDRLRLDRQRRY